MAHGLRSNPPDGADARRGATRLIRNVAADTAAQYRRRMGDIRVFYDGTETQVQLATVARAS
jgi:hypothetical protein